MSLHDIKIALKTGHDNGTIERIDTAWMPEWEKEHREKLRAEQFANPPHDIFKDELVEILGEKEGELEEINSSERDAHGIFPLWLRALALEFLAPQIKRLDSTVKSLKLFIAMNRGETPCSMQGRLTEREIEAAKSFPIERLIEIGRGRMAICPFHNDRHPSMYTKNNYAYCFVCGWKGDVIDLFMHLQKVDFMTAVKQLAYAR